MNNYNVSLSQLLLGVALNLCIFSQIISKLGNGAQGIVHLVEDKVTKEMCVVKRVSSLLEE